MLHVYVRSEPPCSKTRQRIDDERGTAATRSSRTAPLVSTSSSCFLLRVRTYVYVCVQLCRCRCCRRWTCFGSFCTLFRLGFCISPYGLAVFGGLRRGVGGVGPERSIPCNISLSIPRTIPRKHCYVRTAKTIRTTYVLYYRHPFPARSSSSLPARCPTCSTSMSSTVPGLRLRTYLRNAVAPG